jgi:hypothetical protein
MTVLNFVYGIYFTGMKGWLLKAVLRMIGQKFSLMISVTEL